MVVFQERLPRLDGPVSKRVEEVINSFYDEKIAVAWTKCDKDCKYAEKVLKQKLGHSVGA